MKKALAWLNPCMCIAICILLVLLVPIQLAHSEQENPLLDVELIEYAQVHTPKGPLNLRKEENTQSRLIIAIPNLSYVLVNGTDKDNEWQNVTYDDCNGFVQSKYLTFVDEFPFTAIEKGENGTALQKVKKRLQKLGYFHNVSDLSPRYTETFESRLNIFLNTNYLAPTESITPKMQAFMFWGSPKKNNSRLPPATYYAKNSNSSESVTDPASGLTAKVSIQNLGYNLINDMHNLDNHFSIKFEVSGGSAPYNHNVQATGSNIESFSFNDSKLTIRTSNQELIIERGKVYESGNVNITITDAINHKLTISKSISYLVGTDAQDDGEHVQTAIEASIRLSITGSKLNSSKTEVTHTFTYDYNIDGGSPPYQVQIDAIRWLPFGDYKFAVSSSPFYFSNENIDLDFDGNMRLTMTVTDSAGTSAMFKSNRVNFPTILK